MPEGSVRARTACGGSTLGDADAAELAGAASRRRRGRRRAVCRRRRGRWCRRCGLTAGPRGRAAAAEHSSSGGRRGVVADTGSGPGGGVCGGWRGGSVLSLAERGTSLRRWAQRLARQAQAAGVVGELSLWRGMLERAVAARWLRGRWTGSVDLAGTAGHVTRDAAGASDGGVADAGCVGVSLRRARGAADRPGGGGCGVASAAGRGVARRTRARRCCLMWRVTAARRFLPTLTCRGRWAGSPAFIRCGLMPARSMSGALSGAAAAGLARALKRSRSSCGRLPDHGLGYGLLRYLNEETAGELAGFAAPQLGFNYLGRFAVSGETEWAVAAETALLGAGFDPCDAAGARPRGECDHAGRGGWSCSCRRTGRGRRGW